MKKIITVLLAVITLCNSLTVSGWASVQDEIVNDDEYGSVDEVNTYKFDSQITKDMISDMDYGVENIKSNNYGNEEVFGYSSSAVISGWDDLKKDRVSKKNSTIYKQVRNLLLNTNYSAFPLLEYNDPVKLAVGFSKMPNGVFQAFIKTYGDINTKNNLWEQEYEEVLIDLLAKDTLFKGMIEVWDGELMDIISELEDDVISEANDKMSIAIGVFTDKVRNSIKHNIGNILILASIADNTTDKNLQKACQVCMSNSLNASIRAVGDFLIGEAVAQGKDYLLAKQMVQNQILSTSLKKGFLSSIVQKFSLGSVAQWVTGIIFVKDVISYFSGINERVDNYLKTISLSFIYNVAVEAYGKNISVIRSGKTEDISEVYVLFRFMLSVKQKAYEDMEGMFKASTWDAIIDSDQYLKVNAEKIQTITINNYVKRKLEVLTPDVEDTRISLKVNDKKKFPCLNISYLSNVKYSSDNKKIVKVNSSGVIKAKKAGSTYIKCKIEQYGSEYEISCEVTVEKNADSNSPLMAYQNLIKSYEEKYGSAKLNVNEEKQFWTGLCFAKLLDFNDDGVDELILAYQEETSQIDNVKYYIELWEYAGESAQKEASQISWSGNDSPYFGGFSICEYNGKYLLNLTDNAGWENYYYGSKNDGNVGLVHEIVWEGDEIEGDWYLDGEHISVETYQNYYETYHANATWYGFSQAECNDIIKEEISKTKEKLNV